MAHHKIQRALISVSDKTGIVEFAKALSQLNIEILSTGGTYKLLKKNKISVQEVSDYTGYPELMSGRLKTLHPKIHGGILGRRKKDKEVMREHDISEIDLVVVNFYPFEQTIAQPKCTLESALENIDIGGPTMVRAAAKNHEYVSVIIDPSDYDAVITELQETQNIPHKWRYHLATKAFEYTARYDTTVAQFLGQTIDHNGESTETLFPRTYATHYIKQQELRYGENPHQRAAFYIENRDLIGTVAGATQLQGKPLSFNNIADADSAWECVKDFTQPACVIVKHANPCGVAVGDNLSDAYQKAFKADPTSAFGGIIAFNQTLDDSTANIILKNQFVEVIIAPDVENSAKITLQQKSNVRVLSCGPASLDQLPHFDYKRIAGGLLLQEADICSDNDNNFRIVSNRKPKSEEIADLHFAWHVVKFVKSNAIVYSHNGQTVGIGAGQMSRIYSAKIAHLKAQEEDLTIEGSVMASDAFFPFRDGIDAAAEAGITAVIQPGGSVRDAEVIEAANEHNLAMIFTGKRHFRH